MNYTYLPQCPYERHPTVVMTTQPSSKKTRNMIRNPRVSLLVHDWVSHRPPTATADPARASSPTGPPRRSSLANLLFNLNTSALSSISATINGTARLVESGTEEERYFKERHLENNTFEDESSQDRSSGGETGPGDGGRGCYIEGEEVRVVAVRIRDGRVADWKGHVNDWRLVDGGRGEDGDGAAASEPMSNGI